MKKKILYFIRSKGKGRGGHYFSLDHISNALSAKYDVKIISIGSNSSPVIEKNPNFHKHIITKRNNLFKTLYLIKKEINYISPDYFHCFDLISYNLIRLVVNSKKNKIILTICGGPNPSLRFHVKNLILFSLENIEWFRSSPIYKMTNIFLIPNRVEKIEIKSMQPLINKNPHEFVFLRICRISIENMSSIYASINLIEYLYIKKKNATVKLYIIGTVDNKELYQELQVHPLVEKGIVNIYIDDKYTIEASQLLPVADVVIGTGRGLMEASSLGIPLLVLNFEGKYPVLLNKQNFLDAFKTNFSQRNVFAKYDEVDNLNKIELLINRNVFFCKSSNYSMHIFNKYFNISNALAQYHKVYLNAEYSKRYLIGDSIKIFKYLFAFFSYKN